MALNIDLKSIDLKNLPQQSKPIQLAIAGVVVVVILVAAYFMVFNGLYEKVNTLKKEEENLKTTFTEKASQTTNLDDLQNELTQINLSFQALLKQLPTKAEIPNLIQELHQAAASNGLRIDSITPSTSQAVDSVSSGNKSKSKDDAQANVQVIKTLSYAITITGSYQQINDFVHDVGKLSRIVTLNHLTLKRDSKTNMLTLTAIANTYQALSDAEIKALLDKDKDNKDKK
ncbi:type 4a pilus biogenesis protein PilO [Neisseriaceae bacterium ESL0693]|nr:type 4a pilus biogenesis protein PilO [Neisseriaceae bacterium ESL0693]